VEGLWQLLVLACLGVFGGLFSGLVGVGIVMVPLMIVGLGVRPKSAIAASLIVALCPGVVATVGYIATGFQQFSALPPLIVGSILEAGVRIRDRAPIKPLLDRIRGVHDDSSGPAPDRRPELLLGARGGLL
jgi:uncharacterized membrane protein YfcA